MSINLLPWRESKTFEIKRKIILRGFIYFFIFITLSVVIKYILHDQIKFQAQQTQLIQHQLLQIKIDPDFQFKKSLLKKLLTAQDLKISAVKSNQQIQSELLAIVNQLPESLTLSEINFTKNKITVKGYSQNLSDIHDYDKHLKELNLWKKVSLSNLQSDPSALSMMQFTMRFTK